MTDLDLRQTVLETARSAESVEWDALAAAVLDRLTPHEFEDALRQALPYYCRHVTISIRTAGPVHPPELDRQPQLTAVDSDQPIVPRGRSWKVPQIREGWQRRLSEIYATAEGNKRLGDFTVADLSYQAELNQRQAHAKLAKAQGWKRLAETMEAADVKHVRELPAETLMHTLGAVA